MTDVRIDEVHTDLQVVDGPVAIDPKQLQALFRAWLDEQQDRDASRTDDTAMRDRAWRSDVLPRE